MGAKFNKQVTAASLRQAQQRLNIHRNKKLGSIAKTKDNICKHLDAGQEVNAKIWAETLINDENLMPVYDVIGTMCDQVQGRLAYIEKYGAPKDMNETFATIIHSAPKLDVAELMEVRKQLSLLLDEAFVKECNTNMDLINKVVRDNIDFKKPEEGQVGLRLVNLANERNVNYTPSQELVMEIQGYCQRKMIPVPQGLGGPDAQPMPVYQPGPPIQPMVIPQQPGYGPPGDFNGPPPGGPPPGGYGGPPPGGYGGPPPGGYGGPPPGGFQGPPPGDYQGPPPGGFQGPPGGYQPQQPDPQAPNMYPQGPPAGEPPSKEGKQGGQDTGIVEGIPVMPPPQAPGAVDDFQARLDALKNL